MTTALEIFQWMQNFAPLDTAAEWDNVGTLLGSHSRPVKRLMTCLTLSYDVAFEASQKDVDLIITHHPLMLKGVKGITDLTAEGRTISLLLQKNIAVYCPHTAFDNCNGGINDMLAEYLDLQELSPLKQRYIKGKSVGEGRIGSRAKAATVKQVAESLKQQLQCGTIAIVGVETKPVSKIALVCGAGGDFLGEAIRKGADLFITGEVRFHDAVMARDSGIAIVLPGHFATERLGIERLCGLLQKPYPDLEIWPSVVETDPICML